jgi:hypothetical protein
MRVPPEHGFEIEMCLRNYPDRTCWGVPITLDDYPIPERTYAPGTRRLLRTTATKQIKPATANGIPIENAAIPDDNANFPITSKTTPANRRAARNLLAERP